MFENYNFYIFILLFLFAVLIMMFDLLVERPWFIDMLVGILIAIPLMGFVYLLKFQNANVTPFYVLYSTVLVFYVLVFAGVRIYQTFIV